MTELESRLFALQDPAYRDFQRRLLPTVDPETVIGVRMPALRALAKTFAADPAREAFLQALPHRYYEEHNLHGLLVCGLKDYPAAAAALDAFLPFVDNWATCDLLRPRAFAKHPPELPEKLRAWLASGRTYTVRFGLGTLMSFYLDGEFRPEYLELAASVRSDEYYVNMMAAWYFATALAKQWDAAVPYLENRRLDARTHGKTIQKAVESFRIPDERKVFLRTLRG